MLRVLATRVPIWKSAIQPVWKPALPIGSLFGEQFPNLLRQRWIALQPRSHEFIAAPVEVLL